ncbi:alginate lyase family protein [Tunturiibacter gelidoferens]|uniref:Poly(Beta-D-mannuronate) lyase n=1 Tax=Tunturiibacter gelidiferens TaxID=3069689 RepID=A0ACC5P3M1_9BACT|nr:alginate lyase family protein [Edaphobacter lichenicola]MBB5341383.1 poly(beta-D-mannuronate) lyase [Edaphobacter lichenicola]
MKYVTLFLALALSPSIKAQSAAPCPTYPPVLNVSGPEFYSDSKGSEVDPTKEAELSKDREPINNFLSYETQSLDGAPSWSKTTGLSPTCANLLLEGWAAAGAMATTVDAHGKYSREGGVDKGEFTRGMVMLTIKMKASGMPLGPDVLPWLGHLVGDKIKGDREHIAQGNKEGNLYYEDGATAAAYALLTHDKNAFDFQNEVWQYFLASVHDDGYLDSELSRGSRALIYHNRALSMLLALREIRSALHISETTEDRAKLKSLSNLVGHSICHPEEMAARAGVASEESMGDWGYRVQQAYGADLLNKDWQTCGIETNNLVDLNGGGDLNKMRQALIVLAQRQGR